MLLVIVCLVTILLNKPLECLQEKAKTIQDMFHSSIRVLSELHHAI